MPLVVFRSIFSGLRHCLGVRPRPLRLRLLHHLLPRTRPRHLGRPRSSNRGISRSMLSCPSTSYSCFRPKAIKTCRIVSKTQRSQLVMAPHVSKHELALVRGWQSEGWAAKDMWELHRAERTGGLLRASGSLCKHLGGPLVGPRSAI